ncbi:MAG: Uma2 family endonuclease [Planctomycetota bacterium]
MLNVDPLAPGGLRYVRREEFDRMVEVGLFRDEKVELLRGLLVTMSPSGAPHMEVIDRLNELLVLSLTQRARVRVQGSFAASAESQPEPDIAVVPRADHSRQHPQSAHLVVEVSDSSLARDRQIKAAIYASSGVPEYWIVNLVDDVIEVRTEPQGDTYARVTPYRRGESICLTAFPDVTLEVDAILPSA